jgi:hypothetical protein
MMSRTNIPQTMELLRSALLSTRLLCLCEREFRASPPPTPAVTSVLYVRWWGVRDSDEIRVAVHTPA